MVMKITHDMALNLNPLFLPLNQLLREILDFEFWIANLLYRFALSFFIKLIRRLPARLQLGERRTLNPKSKIQNPKFFGISF